MDFAIHSPHGDTDTRNYHAHVMLTTRKLEASGLGEKSNLELENKKLIALGLPTSHEQLEQAHLAGKEKKQKEPTIPDLRKDARIIPASPHSMLTLPDGATHECFVIDMSVSGLAVSAQVQPQIGMPLAVGACIGRVVRLLPDGFAVKFVEQQNRHDLGRLIARAAPPSTSPPTPGATPRPAPAP